MKLTQAEACEAMRAYLQSRGALPPHGKVLEVGKDEAGRYGSTATVTVTVDIGEPPALSPAPASDIGVGA